MKELLDMDLHDEIDLDRTTSIVRVPGGWIYLFSTEGHDNEWTRTSQFVPFNDEFPNQQED